MLRLLCKQHIHPQLASQSCFSLTLSAAAQYMIYCGIGSIQNTVRPRLEKHTLRMGVVEGGVHISREEWDDKL